MFSSEQLSFYKDSKPKELIVPVKFYWITPEPDEEHHSIEVFYFHKNTKAQPSEIWPGFVEKLLAGDNALPIIKYRSFQAPFGSPGRYISVGHHGEFFIPDGAKVYQAKVVDYSYKKFRFESDSDDVLVRLGSKQDPPLIAPHNVGVTLLSPTPEAAVNSNATPVPGIKIQFCVKTGDAKKTVWKVKQESVPKKLQEDPKELITWMDKEAKKLSTFNNAKVEIVSDSGVHPVG